MIRQIGNPRRRSEYAGDREAIAYWLNWLVHNNPLYRDVVIDTERRSQLPVDGDVSDQLPIVEADAAQAERDFRDAAATDNDSTGTSTDSEELWEGAAVPHLMAHQTDVDAFKEYILQGPNAPATPQSIPLRPVSPNISLRRLGCEQSPASSQDSQVDAFNSKPTALPEDSSVVHSPSIPN
ncbi:hypothetical protein E4U50_003162 [Claviceps purpurea]|nr:hypothetical protein E4U50_003162 [Claviceps purpurea]